MKDFGRGGVLELILLHNIKLFNFGKFKNYIGEEFWKDLIKILNLIYNIILLNIKNILIISIYLSFSTKY